MINTSTSARFFFKWTFVFSILIVWTFFVVTSVFAETNFLNSPPGDPIFLGIINGDEIVTQKSNFNDLIDFLFNHDFEFEYHETGLVDDKCSVRAEKGTINYEDDLFDEKNALSFYVSLPSANKGDGSLVVQEGKRRVNFRFTSEKILRNDADFLELEIKGRNGIGNIIPLSGELIFDKQNNIVTITNSEGEFLASDMEVYFSKGCEIKDESFWLLRDNGELEERRSIEEVRQLLDDNPQFAANYKRLNQLYRSSWIAVIPGGIPGVS